MRRTMSQLRLIFVKLIILLCVNEYAGKPFLLGGQSPFPTLFFGSAPQTRESNIADLRVKPKLSRIQENPKLNAEDDDFFKENNDVPVEEENNEALPSLLHKKIGKILNKLQLISTLRGNPNSNRGVFHKNEENGKDDDDFFKDFDEQDDEKLVTIADNLGEEINATTEVIFTSKVAKSSKRSNLKEQETSLSFSPGSIAVFFMELAGTVAGLAYGLAAQLTNRNRGPE